jgi:hypothetical protein
VRTPEAGTMNCNAICAEGVVGPLIGLSGNWSNVYRDSSWAYAGATVWCDRPCQPS